MPIAINPKQITPYVLRCDCATKPDGERGEPNTGATTFSLAPLTHGQTIEAEAIISGHRDVVKDGRGGETITERDGSVTAFARFVVKRGLRGWSNFKTSEGEDAPFTTDSDGLVSDASLSLLTSQWIAELSVAIRNIGMLTPADVGKSGR